MNPSARSKRNTTEAVSPSGVAASSRTTTGVIYSDTESCPACLLVAGDPRAHRLDRRYRDPDWAPWLWREDKAPGKPGRKFCRVCGIEWEWREGAWRLVKPSAFVEYLRNAEPMAVKRRAKNPVGKTSRLQCAA